MGLETAAIVMASVAAASEVGKAVMDVKSADSQEDALNLQGKQQALSYQQKSMQNLDAVQKVLDAQEAAMTVRGTAFSSPSYNAIQRDTINIGSKNQKNLDIEESIAEQNIKTEKSNVKSKLYASLFGDAASIANSAYQINSKMPKMEE